MIVKIVCLIAVRKISLLDEKKFTDMMVKSGLIQQLVLASTTWN